MSVITEDEKVNYLLSQFQIAIRSPTNIFNRDIKRILERMKNLNCKVIATKYLQLNHKEWIGDTPLHLTAINKNSDVFSYLLNSGADFTMKNNNNLTVLHKIIEQVATSITEKFTLNDTFVNLVLSAHLINSNFENPLNDSGLSHFHIACAANNVELVKGFLSSGVVIDQAVKTDSSLFPGFTSLHFAARFCALDVLEVLLSHGADVNVNDAKGFTPLHLALEQKLKIMSESDVNGALRDENEKILELLSVKESNNDVMFIDDFGLSQLHVACTSKYSKVAGALLEKAVNINHVVNMDSPLWQGYTALHFAALCNIDTVKLLLKKGADISIKDAKGVTPFDVCIKRYRAEDIYTVISLNPVWNNIMLSDGKTRLTDLVFAMRNLNQFSIFLRKLSQNFSIYNSALWPGYTPMHLAVTLSKACSKTDQDNEEIYVQILRKLCENNPCMLQSQDVHGYTPLHLAYRLKKKINSDLLLAFLNKVGSSLVDCADEEGLSYLHIAAAENDVTLLKQMLSIGSDVNATYKGKAAFTPQVYYGSTALHFAVVNGSVQAVEILMEKGADIYAKDVNEMTPIHMLLINSRARIPLTIPDLRNCIVSNCGLSHLHIAAMCGKPDCVESLLNNGANINEVITCQSNGNLNLSKLSFLEKYKGYSPLSIAYERSIFTVSVLLKRGADVFVADAKGKALLYNVLEDAGTTHFDDFVEFLTENKDLQARLKVETGMTELHVACLNPNDFDTIQKLLDEGANVNAKVHADSPIFQGYTPLHVALHISKEYDIGDVMEALLKKGADVTLPDAESDTPVHMAFDLISDYAEEMCSYINVMLEAQRDYSVNPMNVSGVTHFHVACRTYNTSIIEEFLKKADIDIDQPIDFFHETWFTTAGYTALHLAASDASECGATLSQLNTVDLLLKRGANVHAKNAQGNTPLHEYARDVDVFSSESLDLFERFVRAGADVNARNIDGKAPLYYFLRTDDITVEGIKTLLRFGCRLNTFVTVSGIGYIGEILRSIPDEEIEKLLSVMSVNFAQELEPDEIGRTVIHNLVSDDNPECSANLYAGYIEQLSKIGCDVDDQDESGRTALHMAAKFHNAKGLSGLLMIGADVNISDNNGKTAFAYNVKSCTLCETYGENANNRKCSHLETLETLAIHVKKLQLCGLDGNEQNEDFAIKAFEKLQNKSTLSEDFFKELETIKEINIGDQSLTLFDFLSETGAVATYPRMPWQQRKAVDKFFSSNEVKDLREKFPELAGILQLQYRKARARPQLMESARKELKFLLGFELPEICSDHILVLLTNSELMSLIASISI